MKNTVKKPRTVQLTARQKAEANMKAYAALAGKRKKLEEKHKAALAELDTQMTPLEAELNQFATENEEDFGGKKSLKLAAGTIGWKQTPGRLSYSAEGVNREGLRDLLVDRAPELLQVDATAVIKAVPVDPAFAATLAGKGVTVVQEDKFYVKPA